MPNRIFLNELTRDRSLPEPEVGQWKTDGNFLTNFAKDIHITGDLDDGRVTSVPSVFARPIQFYQALADEKNPLHRTIVNQWRGLLGALALRDALSLPVRLQRYDVPKYADSQREKLDFNLVTILRSQLPHPAEEWTSWTLIYCAEKIIGASSPWTVVYSPAGFTPTGEIPWGRDGRLNDPGSLFDRQSSERSALSRWIELVLRKHPWDTPAIHGRDAGLMKRLLETWLAELGRPSSDAAEIDALQPLTESEGAPFRPFFSTIPARQVIDDSPSQLKLRGHNVIVLSTEALTQNSWRNARVSGSTTVADLDLPAIARTGAGGTELPTRRGSPITANWLMAETTFLSELLLEIPLSQDAAVLGNGKYALPLTPAFFRYFNLEDIGAPLVSVQETSVSVTVSLQLPLEGGGMLNVKKTYDDAKIIKQPEGTGVPAVTLWPDFTDPGWSRNVAIYASVAPTGRTKTSRQIQVAPIYADGSAAAAERATAARPILVWNLQRPPLGFSFEVFDSQTRGRMSAGVIVRADAAPPPAIRRGLSWKVAVDFGTSNTQIMLKTGEDDQARPLPLQNRSRKLTSASDIPAALLREVTSPEHTVRPPIPTVLRYASRSFSGDSAAEKLEPEPHFVVNEFPFDLSLRYIADFEPNVRGIANAPQRFVADVKWGRSAEQDVPLKAYLQALTQLIACEARAAGAGNLEFRWSYPLSLPRRARATMSSFWSSVRSSLSHGGMEVTAGEGLSESEALARCMAKSPDILPVRAESLSIAIDIGGGSTDIGFWSRSALKGRVSIRMAGNDVIRIAGSDPHLAESANLTSTGNKLDPSTSAALKARPELAWNMLLRNAETSDEGYNPRQPHRHPFLVAMGAQGSDAQWTRCRSAAYLIFAGITYYVGLHARKYTTPLKSISIYFGGRGSSILAWIAPERELLDALSDALKAGLSADLPPSGIPREIRFFGPAFGAVGGSVGLKEEVARGLLEEDASSLVLADGGADTTIVGEMHWTTTEGVPREWDETVTVEQLGELRPPDNHRSGYLNLFLNRVVSTAIEALNLDPRLLQLTIDNAWLQHNMGLSADDRVLEPVFAFELRGLVDAYVKASQP